MGYGALAIIGGLPRLQADPIPTLGGNLDAADYDILHVGVLTLSAITLNDVALVADLGTYRHSSSEYPTGFSVNTCFPASSAAAICSVC